MVRVSSTRERTSSLRCMGIIYWLAATYVPSYLQDPIGTKPEVAALGATLAAILYAVAIPFSGLLSDYVGRRVVMAAGAVLTLPFAYPIFALLDDAAAAATIAGQLVLTVFMLLYTGPWSSAVTELFPTATRYTGMAIGFNVSVAIFGGTAPLVATLLIKINGRQPSSGLLPHRRLGANPRRAGPDSPETYRADIG
jgi:MFS transporter, MHS family, proline/betaine transporter